MGIFNYFKRWAKEPKLYEITKELCYFSRRYKKLITIPEGFKCDGASGVPNIGNGWKFHDWLFYKGTFDDSTRCSFHQANIILGDVLKDEGHRWRSKIWYLGTTLFARKAWKQQRTQEMLRDNRGL